MRVGAPRPRHTSHGEDKNAESNAETSGENTNESGAKEGQDGKKNEDADNEQDTGFV